MIARLKADRGSVSAWVVIFAAVSIVLLVMLVDGGQAMLVKVRVADIAEQGARAAADDVNTGNLRAKGTVTLAAASHCRPGQDDRHRLHVERAARHAHDQLPGAVRRAARHS